MSWIRAEVTECDCLAANPPYPDRVDEGVPRSQVDVDAAIGACESALAVEDYWHRSELYILQLLVIDLIEDVAAYLQGR